MAVDGTSGIYLGTAANVRDALFLAGNDDWNHAIFSGYSVANAQRVGYAYSNNAAWDGEIFRGNSGIAFTGANDGAITLFADTVNKKLGVGSKDWTASLPAATLEVYEAGDGKTPVQFNTGNNEPLTFYNDTEGWDIQSAQDLNLTTKNSGGSWVRVLRCDSNSNVSVPSGNFGIGTTSPAALMHTYGSSNTAAKFESTDANCNIIITDSGGSGINIKAVGDVATISTGDTMAMTIDASQNVGIGDSSPSYKLEVAGTFYASGSSQAFKKNVTDLAVDSSAIYNLNPVSYNYKKDYENFGYDLAEGKQFGLISEEVAEAVPELAIMKDGEPKNVDYQKLSVLLLAEMQKMNKRIKDLE